MKNRVMVAGVPRSGTSLVYETLLHQGVNVGKTHTYITYPFTQLGGTMPLCKGWDKPGMKIIFLFGDPIHSLISTRQEGLEQNPTHWANCGYAPANVQKKIDIFYEDHLNYYKMFLNWYYANPIDHDVLVLRYETLYNHLDLLQHFIDEGIKFPEWRERKSTCDSISAEEYIRIEKNYESMISDVAKAVDVKLMMRSR